MLALHLKAFMKLDKTKYEEDEMDQQKEEEERLLIVMVSNRHLLVSAESFNVYSDYRSKRPIERAIWKSYRNTRLFTNFWGGGLG